MSDQPLKDDLLRHLYTARDAGIRQANGAPCQWIMSQEWLDTARENLGGIWMPGSRPIYLLGFPVTIRPDGGVPHLEPLT